MSMHFLPPSFPPQDPRAEVWGTSASAFFVTLVSYKYVCTVCASRFVNNFDLFCLCSWGAGGRSRGPARIS